MPNSKNINKYKIAYNVLQNYCISTSLNSPSASKLSDRGKEVSKIKSLVLVSASEGASDPVPGALLKESRSVSYANADKMIIPIIKNYFFIFYY